MRIIADFTSLSKNYAGASYFYLAGILSEMAIQNPAHSFILFAGKHDPVIQHSLPNLTIHPIKRFWHRFVLPSLLARLRCDIFITADNLPALTLKIPCCLFVINLLSEFPGFSETDRTENRVIMRQAKASIQKAHLAITFSSYIREALHQRFSVPPEKIKQLPIEAVAALRPLSWEEKEMIKDQYTKGLEFFLFAGDLDERHQLMELLKAFSLFKKWQGSNMQLVIAGYRTPSTKDFFTKTETYKYKSDLILLADASGDTINSLIGAAYAFVYPAMHENFPVNIVKAMRSDVPVITSSTPFIRSMFHESVMYAMPGNAEGFSTCMQAVFKDEQLRNSVIESAKLHCDQADPADIAAECWNFLKESVQ